MTSSNQSDMPRSSHLTNARLSKAGSQILLLLQRIEARSKGCALQMQSLSNLKMLKLSDVDVDQ